MIKIKHLTKRFKNVVAVNDLTIDIQPGINGLVGENGAGKSTLMRLIADVYKQDKGIITIDDMPNDDVRVKKNIFFLSDTPYTSLNYRIKETFELYSSLFDLDEE